tara:strand:+ start:235 stop:459 length:225 start_codon:yes stop_codon:yes gene_type:complete
MLGEVELELLVHGPRGGMFQGDLQMVTIMPEVCKKGLQVVLLVLISLLEQLHLKVVDREEVLPEQLLHLINQQD